MTDNTQPEALRIADEFKLCSEYDSNPSIVDIEKAEAELRRLHAENTALQQGYDAARMEIDGLRDRVQELGAMLRENCNRRIVELEAQLESIGAGGVEPLRRRECLHQISEPVPPESITDQEIYRIAESIPGGLDGLLKGWGWRQFARAVLEHSTRKAEAANPGFLTGFNEINGLPAGEYPALPEPRPIPGFYDLKERSALRYTAQDLIAYVDADRAARAQPADPWREALLDACMPTEACFDGGNPAKTVNNLIDWHLQNERYHVAQRAQPAVAQAAPAAVAGPEHELKDVRCGCCGYMTYHREHMGCIRAAYAARAAAPTTQEAPQPAAPQGDALTLADAAQLEKVIDDFCDCGETDVPYEALQRFAAMGYLECVHYNVLPAAHEAIDAARSQAKKGGV